MRTSTTAIFLCLILATPAAAQTPNIQQLLGGLLTGNQGQDQALREAYRRGYQRGRDDQARQDRLDRRGNYDRRDYRRDSDRGDYRDQSGPDQGYAPPGDPSYDRDR